MAPAAGGAGAAGAAPPPGKPRILRRGGPPQPPPARLPLRAQTCRGPSLATRLRGSLPVPRHFAGDPEEWGGDVAPELPSSVDGKVTSVAGYTGHLPGTKGSIMLNYQMGLKASEHFVRSTAACRAATPDALRGSRVIPARLVDRWGNMKRKDHAAAARAANMYLATLDPRTPVDADAGVGKPPGVDAVALMRPEECVRDVSRVQVPFVVRKRPAPPPRSVGYTGHRPGARDSGPQTFNKIEMMRNPSYAAAPNYEELSSVLDRVPTRAAAGAPAAGLRRAPAASFILCSPIGRRTAEGDFIPG